MIGEDQWHVGEVIGITKSFNAEKEQNIETKFYVSFNN